MFLHMNHAHIYVCGMLKQIEHSDILTDHNTSVDHYPVIFRILFHIKLVSFYAYSKIGVRHDLNFEWLIYHRLLIILSDNFYIIYCI